MTIFLPDNKVMVRSGFCSMLSIMCGFIQYVFPFSLVTEIILRIFYSFYFIVKWELNSYDLRTRKSKKTIYFFSSRTPRFPDSQSAFQTLNTYAFS